MRVVKRACDFIILWSIFIIFSTIHTGFALSDDAAYDSHGKRDPFVPLLTTGKAVIQGLEGVESIDDIVVEGIIYDPVNGSLVIANGLVFKQGEGTERVKVHKIRADGVEFIINERSEFKPFEATDSI